MKKQDLVGLRFTLDSVRCKKQTSVQAIEHLGSFITVEVVLTLRPMTDYVRSAWANDLDEGCHQKERLYLTELLR